MNEKNQQNEQNEFKEESQEEEKVVEEGLETAEEENSSPEQKKIAQLEEKCNEHLDRYQRTLAEFDNFRKRTMKEKASMYDDGVRETVEKLLPVLDNLERAIKTSDNNEDKEGSLLTGIKMVLKQLKEILSSMGVEEIPAIGEKFDPNLHAAVAHEQTEEFGENEIMLEMLKGYRYKDKVIRHSMVKVAN